MPKFTTEKIIHHSAQKMFDLVADVESYPEFLPMCEDLKIRSRKEEDNKILLIADMTINYKFFREYFTTSVFLDQKNKIIDVHYISGPFKYLDNKWRFYASEDPEHSCVVSFFIDYAFKNPMFSMLLSALFDSIFKKFTDAFEKRADIIYGKPSKAISF